MSGLSTEMAQLAVNDRGHFTCVMKRESDQKWSPEVFKSRACPVI